MEPVVWLVIYYVMTTIKFGGVAIEKIPQASMEQCEMNKSKWTKGTNRTYNRYAKCIEGIR